MHGRCPTRRRAWSRYGRSSKPTSGTDRGWDAPFDTQTETSPQVKLARRIAATVEALAAAGPARRSDMLILVRQRGPLFEAIIRALKHADIAVAGADRLVLTEHIAVMDLMVLADALLLPQDDLALATVLKSPLFGFDDEQLFDLAWNRKAACCAALQAQRAASSRRQLRCAARQRRARRVAVRLLCRAARRRAGRRKILARLGPEADDALDEFLNLALDYERRETPSLQGFVAWLRAARGRGQARHGDHPRRGAGDDGARRQGPGGADRHPRRHHHADRTAGIRRGCCPCRWKARAGHARPPGLGRCEGRRRRPIAAARDVALRRRTTNIAGCSTWR